MELSSDENQDELPPKLTLKIQRKFPNFSNRWIVDVRHELLRLAAYVAAAISD
jgi:hypothetical protein